MSENNAGGAVETTKTAEELQESLRKAEAKIVELKKSNATPKEEPKEEAPKAETTGFDENAYKKLREEEKFFESNPDMSEYKEQLKEKLAKGYTWADAKLSVENNDETYLNRKNAQKANFTNWELPNTEKSSYTQEELKSLPQAQYNKVIEWHKSWKITIT